MQYIAIQRDYGQEYIDSVFGESATAEDVVDVIGAATKIWNDIHDIARSKMEARTGVEPVYTDLQSVA